MSSILNKIFDRVYLINLPSEKIRRKIICEKLESLGIHYQIFEAKNGYSEKFSSEWNSYRLRPLIHDIEINYNKKFIESPGAFGILKTHLEVFKDAIRKGYNKILIFEDDILFDRNFEMKARYFFDAIKKKDWKVVLLGASEYKFPSDIAPPYYTPTKLNTNGAFAIGFDKSVFDEIIKEISLFRSAVDNLPTGLLFEKYPDQCFVSFPNLIIADVGSSSVRDKRDMIKHSKIMNWNLDDFIL